MPSEKYTEERPWGKFEQFVNNENVSVKIISLNKDSQLSVQYHNNRDEFWKVIAGQGFILIGEEERSANVGDEFFIPKTVVHSARTENSNLQFLEISYGEFDENDIVRLKDRYGRVSSE